MLNCTRLILALFVLLAISAAVALAQTGTSRIAGTILDSTGAVVAGATVTVVRQQDT